MTSESINSEGKKTLTLKPSGEVKRSIERGQIRQSFAHGRSKTVEVEVRRKKIAKKDDTSSAGDQLVLSNQEALHGLTHGELDARLKAVKSALIAQAQIAEAESKKLEEEKIANEKLAELEKTQQAQLEKQINTDDLSISEEKSAALAKETAELQPVLTPDLTVNKLQVVPASNNIPREKDTRERSNRDFDEDDISDSPKKKSVVYRAEVKKAAPAKAVKSLESSTGKKLNRNILNKVLEDKLEERTRSIASIKRAKQKHHRQHGDKNQEVLKIVRDVVIPETITVSELANRMAVRGAEVIKLLMKSGVMVTINQVIDADTAELICSEFGHNVKRIASSDIEISLKQIDDSPEDLLPRAPIVTVMGHVDHGKTSLLDALRETDVVSGEAGGITQHIGAYQVTTKSGQKITFIDTPGHAAFSEMRARGANVTDIVVLVVAADDGLMDQTLEALNHAKAAKVPVIIAINKIDKPDANPEKVKSDLLQHGVILEEFGGDVLSVLVSAKQRLNLDKLEEAILLQAEVLELRANPNRSAYGAVVESEIDHGRGAVATILVQHGTLRIGDVFVAGTEWGKVRALVDSHGRKIKEATPSMPVEVLGLTKAPEAGQDFIVVDSEAKAREIAEYRQQQIKDKKNLLKSKSAMEQMMAQIASGEAKTLPVVIKTDVQGSLEAITSSLLKLSNDEVKVSILHAAVGGVNESDITLARASSGIIIGFNVRANAQAREIARRDAVDVRYYSIIYDVIDDMKSIMGGMLAPTLREKFLGNAEIREVFNITKVGKVAGCYVNEGIVKRGAKVRLLRDNVVIHEGFLKTLKRFKDEVKEVKESYECGMAFEQYNDIRPGDIIECFETESIARQM